MICFLVPEYSELKVICGALILKKMGNELVCISVRLLRYVQVSKNRSVGIKKQKTLSI